MRKGYRANSKVAFAQYVSTADFMPGTQLLGKGLAAAKQLGQRGFDAVEQGVQTVGSAIGTAGTKLAGSGVGITLTNPTGLKNKLGQAAARTGQTVAGVGGRVIENSNSLAKGALAAGGAAAIGAGALGANALRKKKDPSMEEM
jgi:hypothetical protein